MTKVDVIVAGAVSEEVIVATPQPTTPPPALTPDVGLVEIDMVTSGTVWMTGPAPPTVPGHVPGDMYLGDDGSVWSWDGTSWTDTGINISSSDTPEEILAKLITVDGAGSGLDADLLDGFHASHFATDADMNAAESAIIGLDDRVDAVEIKNTQQDAAIALRLTDAPSDGQAYGRKNAGWADVTEEAPTDGLGYMRKNGAWTPSTGGASTSDEPPPPPLQNGQLWWESDTGNTFIWFDDGNSAQWVQLAGGPGYAQVWVGDLPPSDALPRTLWFRTDKGRLYVLYDDGNSVQWVDTSVGSGSRQRFIDRILPASGTWVKPEGLVALEVILVAGGGGSAGIPATGAGTSSCGGGGGGGAVIIATYTDPSVLPATVDYTVGAGGAVGVGTGGPGGVGGSTTFKGLTANGGGGGTHQAPTASFLAGGSGNGGNGSSTEPASVLVRIYPGGRGEPGEQAAHNTFSVAKPGGSGGNHFIAGDAGPYLLGAGTFGPAAGKFPGGGALGCANSVNQANRQGGPGGAGVIYVREWF